MRLASCTLAGMRPSLAAFTCHTPKLRFVGQHRLLCGTLGSGRHARAASVAASSISPRDADPSAAPTTDASDDQSSIRLYRFMYIKPLRAFLRVKAVQLVAGVGVALPVLSVFSSGAVPTLAEGATVAAVTGGTLVAAGTLSWYMERIVGELAWRPRTRSLVVSTLTMWGDRRDELITAEELAADGFIEEVAAQTAMLMENGDRYPDRTLVPLSLCGKTYVFVWGRKHVAQPNALADLIVRRQWPSDSTLTPSSPTHMSSST